VYTVGHGACGFTEVAALLERHGVATIVDVRSRPFSRHAPEFSKGTLETLAAAHGFGYRWMGDALGGRPDDPALQGPDGSADLDAVRSSPHFASGVANLVALAAGGPAALLCAEARPEACHRSRLIAPALVAQDIRVMHIRHDGSALPHQEALDL
jgi:uncharacterized protein (DUF488 family)